jgi:hypothetical protein
MFRQPIYLPQTFLARGFTSKHFREIYQNFKKYFKLILKGTLTRKSVSIKHMGGMGDDLGLPPY